MIASLARVGLPLVLSAGCAELLDVQEWVTPGSGSTTTAAVGGAGGSAGEGVGANSPGGGGAGTGGAGGAGPGGAGCDVPRGPGAVAWAIGFGGMQDDKGGAVTSDAGGNVIFAGAFRESIVVDGQVLQSAGGADVVVAKLDPLGKAVWAVALGGPGAENVNAIAVADNGDCV